MTTTRVLSRRRLAVAAAASALAILAGCASSAPVATEAALPRPLEVPVVSELTSADVTAWLDGSMPASMQRAGIVGGAVTIVHDGELIASRGYGLADASDASSAVDPDATLFRVGSVSKLFTATAVMQAVERGELDLDVDISQYLDFEILRKFDDPITLRHLLSHTAGFEERIRGLIQSSDSAISLRDALATDPPEQVFAPGTTPAYSNYGNALAGHIVERVSGLSFEKLIERDILKPAGMLSSSFEQPLPESLASDMSNGYASAGQPALPFEYVSLAPAGALSATPLDMSKFMLAHFDDTLMSPDTLEQMHSPALDSDDLGTLAEGPRMALGFFDESRNGHKIIGHGGDTRVFHSYLQLFPDEKTGIFLTFNSSGATGAEAHFLRESILHGFADRYFSGPISTAISATAEQHAQLAQGTYESSRRSVSTFMGALDVPMQSVIVSQPDNTILISPNPLTGKPGLFEEIRPWAWRQVGGQTILTMREKDGVIETISSESAFALIRVDDRRHGAIALPLFLMSLLLIVAGLLAWPIAAIARRVLRVPRPRRDVNPLARVFTRVALISTMLAIIGWVGVLSVLVGFDDVSDSALRVVQAFQVIGLLGVIAAVWYVVQAIRYREGWMAIAGRTLLVLGLAGVGSFALTFSLISASVSY